MRTSATEFPSGTTRWVIYKIINQMFIQIAFISWNYFKYISCDMCTRLRELWIKNRAGFGISIQLNKPKDVELTFTL